MINKNNIIDFKQSYNKALKSGEDMFIFEGTDVLTSYAKYVIQYFNFTNRAHTQYHAGNYEWCGAWFASEFY